MSSLHVVLVEPEIHWNTGNVGRSCVAAGAQLHLVEPTGFSLDEREVRRAGVHHWKKVAPRIWGSWPEIEGRLMDLGEPFFFTAREGRELWEVSFPGAVALVFGKESVGLPGELRRRYASRLVRIPLGGGEGVSLNLSTAVGIALYEVRRQGREPVPPR